MLTLAKPHPVRTAVLLAAILLVACERRGPIAPLANGDEVLPSPAGMTMSDAAATYVPLNLTPNKTVAFSHVVGPFISGGDFGGANLVPVDGAVLAGSFTNVGQFIIAAGQTVHAAPGVVLSISAAEIDIDGTLDVTGDGFPGGPPQTGDLQNGFPGSGPGGGMGSFFGPCVHAPGGAGGSYGGKGGNGGQSLTSPPEAVSGPVYGSTVGPSADPGSGGGSAGSHCGGNPDAAGAGGSGGAGVSLVSSGGLTVNGQIIASGAPGKDGSPAGGCCGGYNTSGGGGGAGGTIYLNGRLEFGPLAGLKAGGGQGGAIVPSFFSLLGGVGYAVTGGGGGGGRVKLAGCLSTPLPPMSVSGGPAGFDGAAGHFAGLFRASQSGGAGTINDATTGPCTPLDATPPVISASVTGTLGTDGWYTSAVSVAWTVTDAESPIGSQAGCEDFPLTANQNATTYTCTASSAGGSASGSVTIKIDQTVPTVSGAVVSGTLGAGGWYTDDVTIAWTASAAGLSGQTMSADCSNVTLTTNSAGTTFTCTVTTGAGVASAQGSVTVKRDATVPTVSGAVVSGTLGNNGWYTSNVTIGWTASAAGPSGQSKSADCSTVTLASDSPGTTFTCTVTTGAGVASAAGAVTVKRDATDPSVGYSGNAGTYTVDQAVSITCAASDALSGLASSTCANVSGPAYSFALGANTFSATATDNAGNSASATTSFTVTVTADALCALVQQWVSNAGVANSLCVKLRNAADAAARGSSKAAENLLGAFVNEVQAQANKSISEAHAATLIQLAGAL